MRCPNPNIGKNVPKFIAHGRATRPLRPSSLVRARRTLELGVNAGSKQRYGPAVSVVGWVSDELIVQCQRRPLVDVERIESLEDRFRAVVERAVADEQAVTAGGEEIAMRGGKAVYGTADADPVTRSSPRRAKDRDATRDTSVDIGERENLVVAVVPAYAGKNADILAECLLEVGVEAYFQRCCRLSAIAELISSIGSAATIASTLR